MKKTVVALALATAASAAFATARDPNKECFESPQYPHGTPACTQPTPPPAPPVTVVRPVTVVAPVTTVAPVVAPVIAPKVETTIAPVVAPVIAPKVETTVAPVIAPKIETTIAPEISNDSAAAAAAAAKAEAEAKAAAEAKSASESKAINGDQTMNYYGARPAAATAIGAAPAGATNLDCGLEIRLGAGVQSLDHGTSVSVAIPLGRSESCRVDNKWKELAQSTNDVDQGLKHELAAEMHPETYGKALKKIDANVGAMLNGKDEVTIQPGEAHRLLGGNLARLRVKPTIVTVEKKVAEFIPVPVATPAPAAEGGCKVEVHLHHYNTAAAARSAGKKISTPAPVVQQGCERAVADALEKAKAAAPGTPRP